MGLKETIKKLYPKIFIASYVIISALLLYWYPPIQVSHFGINNVTTNANLENQYRTTLAQILGGGAVAIGIYFAWGNLKVAQSTLESNQKNAEKNLEVAQEGQITERFTRAVDQLGNKKIEIRLGGIYALERISSESEKDYWPIMKILAAYIREKSYVKKNTVTEDYEQQEKDKSLSTDIQVILDLICKREHSFNEKLDLRNSNLRNARLFDAHLEGADLSGAHLEGAYLNGAHLEKAIIRKAHLEGANIENANLEGAHLNGAHLEKAILWDAHLEKAILWDAHLEGAELKEAHLEGAELRGVHLEKAILWDAHLEKATLYWAHLEGAYLSRAHLEGAELIEAHLEGASLFGAYLEGASLFGAYLEGSYLREAHLEGAKNLTIEQLSKVRTLYNTKLDQGLEKPLREKYPALFEKPK